MEGCRRERQSGRARYKHGKPKGWKAAGGVARYLDVGTCCFSRVGSRPLRFSRALTPRRVSFSRRLSFLLFLSSSSSTLLPFIIFLFSVSASLSSIFSCSLALCVFHPPRSADRSSRRSRHTTRNHLDSRYRSNCVFSINPAKAGRRNATKGRMTLNIVSEICPVSEPHESTLSSRLERKGDLVWLVSVSFTVSYGLIQWIRRIFLRSRSNFVHYFFTSSWVAKSVASLGKGEGRMVRNYFSFGSHFYNPVKRITFPFWFTTFTFASEEQRNKCQKIDIKRVTSSPVTTALYIRYVYFIS